MTDCSFSRCNVNNLAEERECNDSRDDNEDVTLRIAAPGEPERDACVRSDNKTRSSTGAGEESVEKSSGDGAMGSSASDTCSLESEAAKLLDISASDTKAYDDNVEAVEVVDIVRPRAEALLLLGSSCQREVGSMLPYRRP